jgi:hypothetical protein
VSLERASVLQLMSNSTAQHEAQHARFKAADSLGPQLKVRCRRRSFRRMLPPCCSISGESRTPQALLALFTAAPDHCIHDLRLLQSVARVRADSVKRSVPPLLSC